MAIGRTARGTANGVITGGLGASTLLAGVTVGATGSTLVAFVSYGSGIDVIYGMTWNGTTLGKRPAVGVNPYLECYVLENATAGTGAIVIDDAGGSIGKWELLVTEITGAAAASFDVSASGSGTGTAPSSGNTAIPTFRAI